MDGLREKKHVPTWIARGICVEVEKWRAPHLPEPQRTKDNMMVFVRAIGVDRGDKPSIVHLYDKENNKFFPCELDSLEEVPVNGMKKKVPFYPELFKSGPLQEAFEAYLAGNIAVPGDDDLPPIMRPIYQKFLKLPKSLPEEASQFASVREQMSEILGAMAVAFTSIGRDESTAAAAVPPTLIGDIEQIKYGVASILSCLQGNPDTPALLQSLGLSLAQTPTATAAVAQNALPFGCPAPGCERRFGRQTDLKRHITVTHPNAQK